MQPVALTPQQLSARVVGKHIEPTPLGELIDGRTTLLVFLRHFG